MPNEKLQAEIEYLKFQTQLVLAKVDLIKAKTERIKLENQDVQKLGLERSNRL